MVGKWLVVIGFLSLAVLSGCVLPEGDYIAPSGYHADVYNEQGTQVYRLCSGHCPESTPTPDYDPATPEPTVPPVKLCTLTVQGSPHNVRTDYKTTAPIVGNLGIGSNALGLAFHYPLDHTEWARVVGLNYLTGNEITGWVLVNSNLLYDPLGPCLDVPATYEVTPVPTYTPAPTFTPVPTATPNPVSCTLVAPAANFINVRAAPSTDYAIIGEFKNLAATTAVAQYRGAYTWYKVWWFTRYGWIAGVPNLTLQGNCSELPVDTNPFEITALGLRTVPGAANFEQMYPILAAKAIPYGVSPYVSLEYCLSALKQGGMCIFRTGAPDGPPNVGKGDPRANAREFMDHAALAAAVLKNYDQVWIEPLNEVMGTPMDSWLLEWWAVWMDEYITQAAELGWPPLALPTLPPGHGDILMFSMWKPVLQKLAANGGLFSMHAYTFNSLTDLCICDEWEACRHVHNHDLMVSLGYDIPFTLTEAARQSGNASVSVDDMVCFYNLVNTQGFVHSLWLWVGGYHPVWPNANLDDYSTEIAEKVG